MGRPSYRGLVTVALLLVAWEATSRLVLPRLSVTLPVMLPPPSAIALAGLDAAREGDLTAHVAASVGRVVLAWTAAALCAVPLGLLMGTVRPLGRQLDPVIEAVRPIPPIAWIPISLIWFGIGNTQNRFIVFLGAFFPILLNTVHGVRRIDPVFVRAARCLGATRIALIRKVILPGALPSIFLGLRLGMGSSWASLVAAELVAATSGLGFLLQDARNLIRTDLVFLGMALIGLLGMLCGAALERLQHRFLQWDAAS